MQRRFYLLLVMAILPFTSLVAQLVPNGSFENWTTKSLPADLRSWQTVNTFSTALTGFPTTLKSSDASSGKCSVKLVAQTYKGTAVPGYLVYGNLTTQKGLPYTSRPDSFHLSIKSDIPAGDSATFYILLHSSAKGGIVKLFQGVLASSILEIKGKHSKWMDTVVKIQYDTALLKPDTILVALRYSNPTTGSYVQIDSFKLMGGGSIAQVPNSNFENWDSIAYEDANQWASLNSVLAPLGFSPSVTKSTDAFAGKYAMQLKTTSGKFFGKQDTVGYVTTGSIGANAIAGGFPAYSTRPSSFSFYYKYTAGSTGDSANVAILFRKGGKRLDSLGAVLPPASSYTRYSIVIPAGASPDSINIAFASFNYYGSRHYSAPASASSVLLIDSLTFGTVNAIAGPSLNIYDVNIFPNPTSGSLFLQCLKQDASPLDFIIYNALGQQVFTQKVYIGANDNHPYYLNPGQLSKGVYIYSIKNGQDNKTGKLVIE